ncbi:nuclear transport factor 2 family protein [Streptomyces cyaneofuscatus]|uniref:nuclear transport factor 2 family protein n=1 Tax=Streptomyces cyaneofuscatus TaxID=66883 RepID=UPI0036DC8365
MIEETTDVGAAIAGELQLLDPNVRASRSLAERLLDPDFIDVGASGRQWTYEEMLAALPEMSGAGADGPLIESSGMTGVVLAPGLVHLTYETVLGGNRARRSSLWRRKPGETAWRIYYHQATPVPAGEGQNES